MRKIFLLVLLFFTSCFSYAQTFEEIVEMGKSFIDKPEDIDSVYLYQLPARFCVALTSISQMTGFFAYADFKFLEYFPSQSLSYLGERMCNKIGAEGGYGSVSFGYEVELGQKSAAYKRSIGFGLSNLKWGVRFRYFGLQNNIISTMSIQNPEDNTYILDTTDKSNGLGKMRNFTVNGYYVFNSKRFGYTATNTINVVQKHTSGSFMLGANFMWSDLDTKDDMCGLFESYATVQFAVGGGYSANIVLWNRDIVNNDDRTIRNLTFNITATPMVSLLNYMQTRSYVVEMDDQGNQTETKKKSDVWCYPAPNIMGSSAISLTWGHVYFTSQFQFSLMYFSSTGAVNKDKFDAPDIVIQGYDGRVIDDVKLHGFLYNWSIAAKLFYRF